MAKLKSIAINTFRGILNLNVDGLSHINLIVGDNNCGKTSFLEAIQLLRNPASINNLYRVSRIRDSLGFYSSMTIYDSFINMLNGDESKELSVSCEYENNGKNEICSLYINGTVKKVMFDINELSKSTQKMYKMRMIDMSDNEIDEFSGSLISETGYGKTEKEFKINRFTNITGRRVDDDDLIKIKYLSPISHNYSYTFDMIVKNEKYKDICIQILKLFDENIEDLLYLKSETSYRPVEYVKSKSVGLMPLSTYGDGIKKVLSIANAIAQSQDGILLIDEAETSIHSKYFNDIFNFIVDAAVRYNVQLFITTHSMEVVDGLLNTQVKNDEYVGEDDFIKIITLRKELKTTLSRTLTGMDVYNKRENFNFEVRI